ADPDTYISENSLDAALYAAGAVIEAIGRCKTGEIERAFCAVRPPGHHAEANRAMGFCIFNNIAVGARYAQKIGYKKIFIVDFDVHHGNGTQHIFEDDDTVFYFSTHQYPHYPGTGGESEKGKGKGSGFTFNMPMPHGAGDKEYFSAYNEVLPKLIKKFGTDMILVSAGYDIHLSDPLAGIRVSDEGVRNIVKGILSSAKQSAVSPASGGSAEADNQHSAKNSELPVIFSLEGGYDLEALGNSVLSTAKEMLLV
ncbi:MAG: histone deacetylase, partial [Nitrospirae bacterium]